jgi:hypothetical protein
MSGPLDLQDAPEFLRGWRVGSPGFEPGISSVLGLKRHPRLEA